MPVIDKHDDGGTRLFAAANRTRLLNIVLAGVGVGWVVLWLAGSIPFSPTPIPRWGVGSVAGFGLIGPGLWALAAVQPKHPRGAIRRAWLETVACWWALGALMLVGLGAFGLQLTMMGLSMEAGL